MASSVASEVGAERLLTFALGAESYAVLLDRVREILPHEGVRRVPTTPPFVAGLVDVRGRATPVVDLALKFGLGSRPPTPARGILLVDVCASELPTPVGLVADRVRQVLELRPSAIEPAPGLGAGIRAEFLHGVVRLEDEMALVLDLDRVLSATELEALHGLGAKARSRPAAPATSTPSVPLAPAPAPERASWLAFRVGERGLAIDLPRVREILEYRDVTRVPGAPADVRGLVNVRGTAVPLVDPAVRLGLAPSPRGARDRVLLVEPRPGDAASRVGLAVNEVSEILELDPAEIERVPPFGLGLPADRLGGVVRRDGGFLPLVDLDRW